MTQNGIMLIFLAVITALSLQACDSGEETKPRTTQTPASAPSTAPASGLAPGQKAILDNSHINSQIVMVGVTEQDLDEYIKAVKAQDLIGATELSLSGRLFKVPNNTKVLVLENRGMKTNVRIRSGKEAPRAGWVLTPCVKPEK